MVLKYQAISTGRRVTEDASRVTVDLGPELTNTSDFIRSKVRVCYVFVETDLESWNLWCRLGAHRRDFKLATYNKAV